MKEETKVLNVNVYRKSAVVCPRTGYNYTTCKFESPIKYALKKLPVFDSNNVVHIALVEVLKNHKEMNINNHFEFKGNN